MAQAIGIVFVNTQTCGWKYEAGAHTESTLQFFETLGIKDVSVYTDLARDEVYAKFEAFSTRCREFRKGLGNLTLLVRWIGHHVDLGET